MCVNRTSKTPVWTMTTVVWILDSERDLDSIMKIQKIVTSETFVLLGQVVRSKVRQTVEKVK